MFNHIQNWPISNDILIVHIVRLWFQNRTFKTFTSYTYENNSLIYENPIRKRILAMRLSHGSDYLPHQDLTFVN